MKEYPLWQGTLGDNSAHLKEQREALRQSLLSFRDRVKDLVSSISSELPGLTVHDITHIDALWRVAGEIAGPDYPINPAEAYVLGGAFLLHDAAHVIAAYPGGLNEIKGTTHWKDLIAQRYNNVTPSTGSAEEKEAIFFVLRLLHAEQAHTLANTTWTLPNGEELYLIEDTQLRKFYGEIIGDIAASHHWQPHEVVNSFRERFLPPPAFLQPAAWTVDTLKIAFLLRTADAAHIDSARAPWFLFALKNPSGISYDHWQFQAKMAQPIRNENNELLLCAPSPFTNTERNSWWLAFDTARMINSELISAHQLMQEENRQIFATRKVAHLESSEAFAKAVRTKGWEPLDFGPTVGDVPKLIRALGGAALYGDQPVIALRELMQNAIDAIHAFRHLNELGTEYGEVVVLLNKEQTDSWELCVQDNGIGMSRYVLTKVLLDFGNSLWKSDKVREELPGLAKSGFCSGGQFGIGFYSVFMASDNISIVTRRFERSSSDNFDQWKISFESGLYGRPLLSQPEQKEKLIQSGTRISLKLTTKKLTEILSASTDPITLKAIKEKPETINAKHLNQLIKRVCPASDIQISTSFNGIKEKIITPNDWRTAENEEISARTSGKGSNLYPIFLNNGNIIGRLGMDQSIFNSAHVALNGIQCGVIQNVSGLILTDKNNNDAKRTQATLPSNIDWRQWAETVLNNEKRISHRNLLLLHPLIPERDLRVWEIDGAYVYLSTIENHIKACTEITTHAGEISHDDDDDMSSSRFDFFEPIDKLVCVPELPAYLNFNTRNQFPWCADAISIDYRNLLEERLTEIWGGFTEESEDGVLVGEADGQDVYRSVTRYSKKVEY